MSVYATRIILTTIEPYADELQETIDEFLETVVANGFKPTYEYFVDGKCVAFNDAAWWQPEAGADQQITDVQGEQA
jgi:hypothetical protein